MNEADEIEEKLPADFFLELRSYDLAFSELNLSACGFNISGFSKGDVVTRVKRKVSMWKIELEWNNDRAALIHNLKKVIGLIGDDKKKFINSTWLVFVPTEQSYEEFYLDSDDIEYFKEHEIGFGVRTSKLIAPNYYT